MRVEKLHMTVQEQAEQEYANAMAEQNYADTVYLAMMSGIDIPSMDGEEGAEDGE